MPRKCQKQSYNNNVQVYSPISEETEPKLLFSLPIDIHRVLNKAQKPRRNKSAFLLFSSEKRALLKANGENLNSNQMMAKLAELWNNISPQERRRYDMEAIEEKKRYLQELEAFKKENPYAAEVHNKTKKNHIKKPCSAYGIFVKEATVEIKKENPGLLMADVLKIVSQRWKNLNEEEKIRYQEKALQEKYLAREMLEQKYLEEQSANSDSSVKQKKEKQSGEAKKRVKMDNNCFVEANSDIYSSPFDLSFGPQEFTEEAFPPQEDFNFMTFDFSNIELLPTFSICNTQSQFQPNQTIQVSEIQQLPTPALQVRELNFSSFPNFSQEDLSIKEIESQDIQNLLERFNSTLPMFNSGVESLECDAFDLVDKIPLEVTSNTFSSSNAIEDFSLTATCSFPSQQKSLNNILLSS